ncbi:MAG TPA: ATP-binding protein, partial [Solirubrobacteraceae bacterium]
MLETAPPLLEREDELARIEGLVGGALERRGALAVVTGHAGVGKTRLLQQGRELAAEAGLTVCRARGSEIEREFAFGVVRQLVDPLLLALGAERRAELLAGPAAGAAPLLGGAVAPAGPALTDASFATLHGLYWLLATLAEQAPLALVADDVHWADEPSLRFLDFLGRRLDGLAVLVLAGARPEPDPLLEALADGAAAVLRPQPLSPTAAGALVERAFAQAAPAFVAACVEATGGNPFLLGELLAGLAAEGVRPDDAGRDRVRALGPAGVRRSAAARVRRISPAAACLAAAVAVLGPSADLREAAALAGIGEG